MSKPAHIWVVKYRYTLLNEKGTPWKFRTCMSSNIILSFATKREAQFSARDDVPSCVETRVVKLVEEVKPQPDKPAPDNSGFPNNLTEDEA